MYIIPTILCTLYIILIILNYKTNLDIKLLQDSQKFDDLCKSLLSYTSILIGVYGFFIPVIIGKMNEQFSQNFWKRINRNKFVRDNQRIFLSGIATVLLSAILLVSDILNVLFTNILICALIWSLLFFSCSSYRFIGIFIHLIIGDNKNKITNHIISNPIKKECEEFLDQKLKKF